ncbi:MAG: hypothetical protein GY870_03925 [archaeon]|nr:hypothetical protein [archaeon]
MKKTDFLNKMSEMTGISVEKITENITSEKEEIEDVILKDTNNEGVEVDINLSDLTVFKPSELATRLKNHAALSAPTFIEQAIKSSRKSEELDFKGKTLDNLVVAAIEKGRKEANIKPNEKITELENVAKTLRQNIIDIEQSKNAEIEQVNAKLMGIQNNSFINSSLPDNLDTQISTTDLVILFKNDIETKTEDGIKYFYKDGIKLVDQKTQTALGIKEVMNDWLTGKNIKTKNTEGRSGKNEFGQTSTVGQIKNSRDFYEYCKINDIKPKDQPKLLLEIQAENKDFQLT